MLHTLRANILYIQLEFLFGIEHPLTKIEPTNHSLRSIQNMFRQKSIQLQALQK